MKILLVNPQTSNQPGFKKSAVIPYGILFLAAVLEKVGYQVVIYDNNVDDHKPAYFAPFAPDIVGFSVITGSGIGCAIEQSKQFRELLPGAKIVWGGVHPSLLPEQTAAEPYIDFIVVGEGEHTLVELCHAVDQGKYEYGNIRGLVYKENGAVIRTEQRPFIKNLDELPDPAWHLIDVRKYDRITLNTSRGCPFRCAFCYNVAYNKGRRSDFSARRVISWIKYFRDTYSTRSFKFYEDNFTFNRKRLKEFCNLLIAENVGITWESESRVNLTEEEIALMAKSGCYALGLGIESGSPRMLELLQKDISLDDVRRVFKLLAKYDIGPGLYLMAGLPTETMSDFEMTLKLRKELRFLWCEYMIYHPYPGTRLYDYCVSNKLFKPPRSLAEWINFADLYDINCNTSKIPTEVIQQELDKFKKYYIWTSIWFSLRQNRLRALSRLFNPRRVFLILSNIAAHYKAYLRVWLEKR